MEWISLENFRAKEEKITIHKNIEKWPRILKSEVRSTLAKINKNKVSESDGIVIETLSALDAFGIDKITEIVNEIYDIRYRPEDLSRTIFRALPKKVSANECKLHRKNCLMNQAYYLKRDVAELDRK